MSGDAQANANLSDEVIEYIKTTPDTSPWDVRGEFQELTGEDMPAIEAAVDKNTDSPEELVEKTLEATMEILQQDAEGLIEKAKRNQEAIDTLSDGLATAVIDGHPREQCDEAIAQVAAEIDSYDADTLSDVLDNAINKQHDESATPETDKWGVVVAQFASQEPGSTTRACSLAAEILLEDHDFVALRDSGALYYYDADAGYYQRKGKTYITELLYEYIPHHVNTSRTREITEEIKNASYIGESAEFNPPEHKVNVRNGVIDLRKIEVTETDDRLDIDLDDVLEPHSPDYHFTAALDCDFEPGVQNDLLDEQLARTIDDEGDRHKLLEFVGYCLEQWHHDREKNLFLVGPSATGKSTIQETIESLFGGPPTVSNLTPQQVADTRFDGAALFESTLNTVNDINATKVEDTGTLKRIWAGEQTKLENKFQDAFFAAPNAKHLYTANWLPNMVGQDEAVYRRVLIIECTNKIDDEDIDRTVKARLNTDEVRQALLNKALIGRERLREQGGFTNDRNRTQTRLKWDSWRDSHKRFLHTQFHITGIPSDQVDQAAYHRAFTEFIGRTGYQMKSKASIAASIKWMPEVESERGRPQPVYTGIRWKEDDAADETASETPRTGDERLRAVKQAVANNGGLRFVELRATLGEQYDIPPSDATTLIETASDNGTIEEDDAGMFHPA